MITSPGVLEWRVFFVAPQRRWPTFADPVAQRSGDRLSALLRAHDRVQGQPFLLGPDRLPDRRVNGFFASARMLARDEDTWRKYAYAVGMGLNFLAVRGLSWDQAVPEDVEAFKLADDRRGQPAAGGAGHGPGQPDRAECLLFLGRSGARGDQSGRGA
ncbi:hypothetical protein [Saccharopolyspora pogona]|uniref:hypothetical protein n=1 Tax=Saccharopolyspora pogona TaxID=333966 RepID=UPI0016831FC3|nr:hypothetical protein [Saccharopolyspora pogona]